MYKKIVGILVCVVSIGLNFVPVLLGYNTNDYIDQQQTNSCGWGQGVNNEYRLAQSFIPDYPYITRVIIKVFKDINSDKGITLSIRNTLDGADLVTLHKSEDEVPSTGVGTWIEFNIADLEVTPGETYYIIWAQTGGNATDKLFWPYGGYNPYTKGEAWHKAPNWQILTSSTCVNPIDFCFVTYGITNDPVAEFTYNPQNPKNGEEITFDASSSYDPYPPGGYITSYDWDLDNDGQYDDGSGEIVTYNWYLSGDYKVGLQVTDNQGYSSTITQTINVGWHPFADFSWNPQTCFVSEMIFFNASDSYDEDGFIEKYEWDFDNDGFFDDGSGVFSSYSWDEEGTYKVSVKVTDNSNMIDTIFKYIVILSENYPPEVDILYPFEGEELNNVVIIDGVASDLNGDNTLVQIEVQIDNKLWEIASGLESWSYIWDTSIETNGNHTIYARSYDGSLYSDISMINITVFNTLPEVVIDGINGGLGISINIANIGTALTNNVNWSIDVEPSIGLILSGSHTENVIDEILEGGSDTVHTIGLRGIGWITITVQVADVVKQATAFLLGPLVLRVNEI